MQRNNKKDKSLIPRGDYCYDENGNCPYWSIWNNLPEQLNGYCAYLEKSDMDFEETFLLWDQIKNCGINEYDEELDFIYGEQG